MTQIQRTVRRIITRGVIDWATLKVEYSEGFSYRGPVSECQTVVQPNQYTPGQGGAVSPRSVMLPPNIFDPRTDGSDYYWYVTNFGAALAAGGTTPTSIQIDNGTDFYWIATSYQTDTAGATLTESTNLLPLVTVLINDTGTSRNLMNAALPITTIAGDGKRPYRLVRPRLFRANSVINFTWVSYEASITLTNIYLTLHGYRRLVQPPGLVG